MSAIVLQKHYHLLVGHLGKEIVPGLYRECDTKTMDPLLSRLIPYELESMQQRANERSQCSEVIRLGSKHVRVGRLEMIIGGHRSDRCQVGRHSHRVGS